MLIGSKRLHPGTAFETVSLNKHASAKSRDGFRVLKRGFYLPSSKPFSDAISAFSSPTVWLSRMRLVEDAAYKKATNETLNCSSHPLKHTPTHTHTPAPFRSRAAKVNTVFSTTLLCSVSQHKLLKKSALFGGKRPSATK